MSVPIWARYLSAFVGLIWPFQKILWITYFGFTISKISTFKNAGFRYSFVHAEIFLFTHYVSRTVKSKAY